MAIWLMGQIPKAQVLILREDVFDVVAIIKHLIMMSLTIIQNIRVIMIRIRGVEMMMVLGFA